MDEIDPVAWCRLINDTGAIFSLLHLRELVEKGLWDDALRYIIPRFLAPTTDRQSDEALVLLHFIHMHKNLANIVAGNMADSAVRYLADRYNHYANHDSNACSGAIRIHSIVLSMLHSDQLR